MSESIYMVDSICAFIENKTNWLKWLMFFEKATVCVRGLREFTRVQSKICSKLLEQHDISKSFWIKQGTERYWTKKPIVSNGDQSDKILILF